MILAVKIEVKIYLLLLALSFSVKALVAQPEAYFEHYGAEDGLPQHTVTDILQDRKGFMWFSTWDGLSKFDGYTFTTYHLPSGEFESRSSRIDKLYEDKFSNIWALSYDNRAYRFKADTESFTGTSSIEGLDNKAFTASQIIPMESGKVWLLSEGEGCIAIADSLFSAEIYKVGNQNLTADVVHTVHEDANRNTWILTGKGLTRLPADGDSPLFYFHSLADYKKDEMPFFSVMELEHEIWFGSSGGTVWIYNQNRNTFEELSTGLLSDIISIQDISTEKILIVSRADGFAIYNTHDGSIHPVNTRTYPEMKSDGIITSYIDRSKNVWLETDQLGVSKYNPYTGAYIHFTPYVESGVSTVFLPNFFIFEDVEDRLWVHPRGGGFSIYDKTEDKLIPFYNEPFSPTWLFSNMLHSAYSDRQGNLWMCSRSPGLEKVIFYDASFKSILPSNNATSTISNEVRPIFEDSRENIWIGTKDGKVRVYDGNLNEMGILNNRGEVGGGTPLSGIAYCITEDSENNIWVGTKGHGVYKLTRKEEEHVYDVYHFKNDPSDTYSLSNNDVYSIFEDRNKNIWIGTYGGGLNLIHSSDKNKVINHLNDLSLFPVHQADRVRVISEDKYGNICVGTTLGFITFDANFKRPQDIHFRVYTRNNNNPGSIGANDIIDICTTKSGETYIGTFGGGVSKIDQTDENGFPLSFEVFNSADGLSSNIILSIEEDKKGNLWIASEGGLTKFDRTGQTFENFSEIKRIMKRYNFSENSSSHLRDGRIIVGTLRGMIVFDPQSVKNNRFKPYLALVNFKLFNRSVPISPDGLLKQNINTTDNLVLKHNQNSIGIDFAALDYVDPANILYMYKLEGFDKEWVYVGKQRTATYTNLSAVEYLFHVKSTNSDGVWVNNDRALAIKVLPPFWVTGWAYLVYILVGLLLLYGTFKILYTFYKMRNKIVLEKQESAIKTRFFTNISHEIRTPLTMIVSPVENILSNQNTPEPIKKQLVSVSKNTNRLLNMVNQILDFQKIEQGPLTVSKFEIAPFVATIFNAYAKNAEMKNINYTFEDRGAGQFIWADADAVEKIVVNLLSNALKYTPDGGAIHGAVYHEKNSMAVRVSDTGVGISKENQTRLFKRFASFNEDKRKPSTGIGLSIVKEMADKLGAEIKVESEEHKGSSFTVLFKKGTSHLGPDLIISNAPMKVPEERTKEVVEELENQEPELVAKAERSTVLIVEDDTDLRQFIISILESDYDVHEAADGKEGYEKAVSLIPDFIVSDIMMPVVDGIELLEKVRENPHTSHILFLLLTAKTTIDSKLEGFESGADEYITKPFSVSYFKTRVRSLLQRRSELQDYYRERRNVTNLPNEKNMLSASVNEKDIEFIQSVNTFIEQHIGNSDFVIEDIAIEIGMSRTVFFKKLKGLTGLAPVEYVRDILLQHAAELLENEDFMIKEVAHMIGMSDPKYFSKCFKKKYNMTPGEYRKLNRVVYVNSGF